jgi:hypothetical protein
MRHGKIDRRMLRPRPHQVGRDQGHRRPGEAREIGELHQRPRQRQARESRHPQSNIA